MRREECKLSGTAIIPTDAAIYLTYRCNLRCVQCTHPYSSENELAFHEVKNILSSLAGLGARTLTLRGGEIFLREDTGDIIEYARTLGLSVRLVTNGTTMDIALARELAGFDLTDVEIPLYGIREYTHSVMTRNFESFGKTLYAARLLHDEGIPVTIRFVITRFNVGQAETFVKYCRSAHLDYYFSPLSRTAGSFSFEPSRYVSSGSVAEIPMGEVDILGAMYPSRHDGILCTAGRTRLAISPSGELFPCERLTIFCGDVRRYGVDRIWQESPVLARLRTLGAASYEECSSCPKSNFCRPCMALNYAERTPVNFSNSWLCKGASLGRAVEAIERSGLSVPKITE